MKNTIISLIATISISIVDIAFAQEMNYQGRLTDSQGDPLVDGQYTLSFSIYDSDAGGNLVWGPFITDGSSAIAGHGPLAEVINGRFNIVLGPEDLSGDLLESSFSGERYLEITVAGNAPISPRQKVLHSPTSLHAINADNASHAINADNAGILRDTTGAVAFAQDGFLQVPEKASLGSNFALTSSQTNRLNFLIGENSNGFQNGISFWEVESFGMSLGYDGTLSGEENAIRIYDGDGEAIASFENGGNMEVGGGILLDTTSGETSLQGIRFGSSLNSTRWRIFRDLYEPISVVNDIDSLKIVSPDNSIHMELKEDGRTNINGPANIGGVLQAAGGRFNGYVGITGNAEVSQDFLVVGTAFKPGGGSWTNISDERVKKNIAELEGSLEKLSKLRPVTFEYQNPSRHHAPDSYTGFIAQEVELVFPEWIKEMDNSSPLEKGETTEPKSLKAISVHGFEALTVDALRELRAEKDAQIETLRANTSLTISQLEQKNKELSTQLKILTQQVDALSKTVGTTLLSDQEEVTSLD